MHRKVEEAKKGVRRIKVVSIGETIRDSGVSGSMYWARNGEMGSQSKFWRSFLSKVRNEDSSFPPFHFLHGYCVYSFLLLVPTPFTLFSFCNYDIINPLNL